MRNRLTRSATIIRTIPNAMPNANSPLLVSRAIAVVIVRVYPRMFPPSIIATPTSETTRPKPAITAARMPNRISPTSARPPGSGRRPA